MGRRYTAGLEDEAGAISQGMQVASRSWQGPREHSSAYTLILAHETHSGL